MEDSIKGLLYSQFLLQELPFLSGSHMPSVNFLCLFPHGKVESAHSMTAPLW